MCPEVIALSRSPLLAALLAGCAACTLAPEDDDPADGGEVAIDAAPLDAAIDGGPDGGDAALDATLDAAEDAAIDAGTDGGVDAAGDIGGVEAWEWSEMALIGDRTSNEVVWTSTQAIAWG